MSLRQQQVAVFLGTVLLIFGLFAAGVWLIAQRLTREATLQTALVMARQVEIALADSLRQRPAARQPQVAQSQGSSFWSFLGNIFPGPRPAPRAQSGRAASRQSEVKGLMRAFVDRSGSIEAMWVLNAEGRILYSSLGQETGDKLTDRAMYENLRRGIATVNARQQGGTTYYDVLVPLQMPEGVRGPGGLRLWVNPADWTELISGMWRQLTLLFALGGGIALLSAFLTTALYTKRFRLIADTLRSAEAGTYSERPAYASRDEVGTTLDLIDRLVMKQRQTGTVPATAQRLAMAARTLAHEVRTPLNALAIHLELLRNAARGEKESGAPAEQQERSLAALDAGIRQVERLVRDFTDYSAPVTMERKPVNLADVLAASLEAISGQCAAQKIALIKEFPAGPCIVQGDGTRLRQSFDNLLRNAMEAQPNGGEIRVSGERDGARLTLRFSDAGPGVPPERRSQLFEFGKTTKIGGSGIGLPLSQLIVEAHGGSLRYEDRNGVGRGATFVVTLPLELS
ncbi:MAG TPA: HAMP domain-containing sensor histidine kinase [candidate division Zixibacteria bacterium]|nr:HAMP domain-containing sensor histidine kinase [candidate division Zixibacteria bacterium]